MKDDQMKRYGGLKKPSEGTGQVKNILIGNKVEKSVD